MKLASSALTKVIILIAAFAMIMPLAMMASMGTAQADGGDGLFEVGAGGGEPPPNSGGESDGASGSDFPKADETRNEPTPGGSKVKYDSGKKSNSYVTSRTTDPLTGDVTVVMETTNHYTGVVDFRNGNVSASAHQSFFRNANVACASSTQTRDLVGAKITIKTLRIHKFIDGTPIKTISTSNYAPEIVSVQCLSLNYSIRTAKCYVDATGTINKVAPTRSHITTKTAKTSYGKGDRSYAGCLASRSVVVNVATVLSGYGRWEARASFRVETVKARVALNVDPLTGKKKPTEIISRSGVSTAATKYNYAQITCRGASMSASKSAAWTGNPKYTHTECDPASSNPVYQCTGVNDLPVINGQATRSATLFRDGEENSIKLPSVGLTGNGVKINSTKTQVLRTGTPWNTNGAVNARTNDVQLKQGSKSLFTSNKGTPWMSGKQRDFTVSSVWSSDKGLPTTLTGKYEFNASIRVPTIRINGWKVSDTENQVYYSRGSANITSTAVCTLSPINLDFVRSKETNGPVATSD